MSDLRERVEALIEKYCGEDDEGSGADKPWSNWKREFAEQILALLAPREEPGETAHAIVCPVCDHHFYLGCGNFADKAEWKETAEHRLELLLREKRLREDESGLREHDRRVFWQGLAYRGMRLVDKILGRSAIHGTGTTEQTFESDCDEAEKALAARPAPSDALRATEEIGRLQNKNSDLAAGLMRVEALCEEIEGGVWPIEKIPEQIRAALRQGAKE